MTVSHTCYDAAGPLLYRKLRLTRENAGKVFTGLARTHPASKVYRAKMMSRRPNDQDADGKRVTLAWPAVTVESEDEEEEDPFAQHDFLSHTYTSDYPNAQSHERKRSLLWHVKHLTIGSVPDRCTIAEIRSWQYELNSTKKCSRLNKIFTRVKTLSMEGQAILEMHDWHNRRDDRTVELTHPLVSALASCLMSPRHICLTYPDITDTHLERYIEKRISPGLMKEEESEEQENKLRKRFKSYVSDIDRLITHFEEFRVPTTSSVERTITIHNLKVGDISIKCNNHIRIFLSHCECKQSRPHVPSSKGCHQHVNGSARTRMMRQLARHVAIKRIHAPIINQKRENEGKEPMPPPRKCSWEIICEGPQDGITTKTDLKSRMESARQSAITSHRAFGGEKVEITDWEDAKACRCCGKK